MATVLENDDRLKEVFKSAIVEVLLERRELVRELLGEIIEDVMLSRAIADGENTAVVPREQIFELLETAN
jgi:hypothetical protein